ncbi:MULTISPECIES: hypothetical protein [unclassified Clostridioides]|uniref:hypothetical protein n=1 Tax=unclassified Clostridioides TaxID=2635829 RepID=UPI001D11C8B3|nr:hypothetical protein [Clostridioides sp. ZZV15-6388]MCC0644090.1 hypothetical protein [Clostridioides sp. ZZV14-6150]MCC0660977.1 hypothetical protein [Clostridioides sp. ZZV14-6154]MCC0664344.1 hypothetical protein [Clostridioides sp. ZZV15-6597]MCC0668307.1 hypothetical protein [Clostridioides sp. ZZV14-6153]MCC0720255.1 hypothetical protein [Clostridioides sp. ZZV14-6105]MCC0722602.1 hypothetical protein [Clostridioides sp. ZZV14-6104]MCC0728388.1 hypothetical protein [Clostridioides s
MNNNFIKELNEKIEKYCVSQTRLAVAVGIKDILHINPKYMLQCEYGKYGYENKYIIGYIKRYFIQDV